MSAFEEQIIELLTKIDKSNTELLKHIPAKTADNTTEFKVVHSDIERLRTDTSKWLNIILDKINKIEISKKDIEVIHQRQEPIKADNNIKFLILCFFLFGSLFYVFFWYMPSQVKNEKNKTIIELMRYSIKHNIKTTNKLFCDIDSIYYINLEKSIKQETSRK